jgi:hypothetical protein
MLHDGRAAFLRAVWQNWCKIILLDDWGEGKAHCFCIMRVLSEKCGNWEKYDLLKDSTIIGESQEPGAFFKNLERHLIQHPET